MHNRHDKDSMKNKSLESTTNETYSKLGMIRKAEFFLDEKKTHNPPFFKIVDYLFAKATKGKYATATKNPTAEELTAQIENAKDSAKKWGGIGTVVVTEVGYTAAEKILPNFYGNVDTVWQMLGLTVLTGGMIYYSDDFKQWEKEHPVYMAGMKAATAAYGLTTMLDMFMRHI